MSKKSAAEVFTEYRKRLLQFIRSHVGQFEDAEDILSEVFYQFARVNDTIKPIENTAAWLYKSARNKIIDSYRKKKDESLPEFNDDSLNEDVFDEISDLLYGEESNPETEIIRSLLFEEIFTAIDDLPAEQREVFTMTEFQNFSIKEVSEKTNTPVNTVLSRKHYAVKFLRKRLEELYCDVISIRN